MTKIAVSGATGRMGRSLCAVAEATSHTELTVATVRPANSLVGQSARGIIEGISSDVALSSSAAMPENFDVLIEFTEPELTLKSVEFCEANSKAMVIGTTGFSRSQLRVIEQAAENIPIVLAANMSVGVTVALTLVELAAKAMGGDYDTEIIEAHHRFKKDSPSGTALAFGQVIAEVLNRPLSEHAVYGREGLIGERPENEIGFSTVRGGDVIGDHTVMFLGDGDRLEITHKASHRETFARGAIRAAHWLNEQPPGLYSMKHVLGLE